LGEENTHGPTDGVTSVSISPDGRVIAAVSVQQREIDNGQVVSQTVSVFCFINPCTRML
jgi:hypothetical protein